MLSTTRNAQGEKVVKVHKTALAAIDRFAALCQAVEEDCPTLRGQAEHAQSCAERMREALLALGKRHEANGTSEP